MAALMQAGDGITNWQFAKSRRGKEARLKLTEFVREFVREFGVRFSWHKDKCAKVNAGVG